MEPDKAPLLGFLDDCALTAEELSLSVPASAAGLDWSKAEGDPEDRAYIPLACEVELDFKDGGRRRRDPSYPLSPLSNARRGSIQYKRLYFRWRIARQTTDYPSRKCTLSEPLWGAGLLSPSPSTTRGDARYPRMRP